MTQAIVPKELLTATPGGLSFLVMAGGAEGHVATQQADGTYSPEPPSAAGIGGSVGSVTNRLVKSSGTGGSTVQSTGITVDASDNVTGVGMLTAASFVVGGTTVYGTNAVRIGPSNADSVKRDLIIGTGGEYLNGGMGSIWFEANGYVSWQIDQSGTFQNAFGDPRAIKCGSLIASQLICAGIYTVETLPSAAANAYKFANVPDSSVTTFGSTVAAGGSSKVMVFSNGTNWTVCAA